MTVVQFPTRRDENGQPWEAWIDETAVARHFSVSARTVRRWTADGMPSRRFGGLRRYRLSDCESWHQTREQEAS